MTELQKIYNHNIFSFEVGRWWEGKIEINTMTRKKLINKYHVTRDTKITAIDKYVCVFSVF